MEWNILDSEIRNGLLLSKNDCEFHKTHRELPLQIFLLTRLRFQPSLSEHKFRRNFADSLNPLCSCSLETESTLYL